MSKCTCKHRRSTAHVMNYGVPHEEHCHYAQVHERKISEREDKVIAKALYSTYRRGNK